MTYSIIARCPDTGQFGVAVQSAWFAVGRSVPWVNAGVGVVATQALVEPAYGPKGLTLMRNGLRADIALASLLEVDEGARHRQVAMIDAAGTVAVHTGSGCIGFAEHATGHQVSCQGNILQRTGTSAAMLDAYQSSQSPFELRLVEALEAAELHGGEARGQQSSSLTIVESTGNRDLFVDRPYDIRIDDHPSPVSELRRILEVQSAMHLLDQGIDHLVSGNVVALVDHCRRAAGILPGEPNIRFWLAVAEFVVGNTSRALEVMASGSCGRIGWGDMLQRWSESGAVPGDVSSEQLMQLVREHEGGPGARPSKAA